MGFIVIISSVMLCYSCGKEIIKNSVFCKFCGKKQVSLNIDEEVKGTITFKKYLKLWFLCIVVFFISLYFGGIRNGSFVENPSLIKNISFVLLVASILVGFLSFIFLIYKFVEVGIKKDNKENNSRAKSVIVFLLTVPIFPIYVLFGLIRSFFTKSPRIKDIRWLVLLVNIFILTPAWYFTYLVGYNVITDEIFLGTRYQIGYLNQMESMAPSFPGNSIHKYYPYKNIYFKLNKPYQFQRGDVIAFKSETIDKAAKLKDISPYLVFKRIIGLPGETIELKGGGVFVNDKYLEEPYTLTPNSTFPLTNKYLWSKENQLEGLFLEECQKITVPEDKLFVLGDNRENSDDSRIIGFVDFNDVANYLPLEEQKVTYYEGINPLNHSEKWRDTKNDYSDLINSGKIKCKK